MGELGAASPEPYPIRMAKLLGSRSLTAGKPLIVKRLCSSPESTGRRSLYLGTRESRLLNERVGCANGQGEE